ncbi:DUF4292 domain-containing protein [Hymenobacter cellulosivorans]|uniref:DUF4292 domain-containing protein n=1 Tax=Hymenobacter cellulosivorans TaxID=2932249 RepID=A0ABY4FAG0_9BACT|nr:DUF4292 domain-containing protein [Hymenobacter cellulosivorans]UOQ53488.1 DUF4292 domain-containing protein [Hymenobacter cellulosivorans]
MNKCFPLVLLWVGLLLSGCSSKIFPTKSATTTAPAKGSELVKAKNLDFRYLKAKGKIKVDMPQLQQSANLNLRVRKDSAIWLSVSLGIEGVRAYITRDSVQVINYLQKEYYAGDYAYLSRLLNVPVTFDRVQALLLGNYLPAEANTTPKIGDEGAMQRVEFQEGGVLIAQLIELTRNRVQQIKLTEQQTQNQFTVDFSDFRPLAPSTIPFAYSVLVQGQVTKGKPATATINYRNIDVDQERLTFPFSVPKGYVRKK